MKKLGFLWLVFTAPAFAQPAGGTLASGATWYFSSGIGGMPQDFLRVDPNDSYNAPWGQGMVMQPNGAGLPENPVMVWGWNCGTQGEIVAGQGRACFSHEGNYITNGVSMKEVNFGLQNGVSGSPYYRWLSAQIQVGTSTPDVRVALRGDDVSIGGGTNMATPGQVQVSRTYTYVLSPDQTRGFYVDDNQLMMFTSSQPRMYLSDTEFKTLVSVMPSVDGQLSLGTCGNNVSLRKRWKQGHFKDGMSAGGALADRPTCDWDHERWFFTAEWEMGVATTTYQCCASAGGVLSWKVGVC